MTWLGLEGKTYLVTGVANRKSVAWQIATQLEHEGARVIYSVESEERMEQTRKLLEGREVHICDVSSSQSIQSLASTLGERGEQLAGLVHSIAFANYSDGMKAFHQTPKADFIQALEISCFSLVELSNALKELFTPEASVLTI